MYKRVRPSLLNIEDLLQDRGIEIGQETLRIWWHRFGPMFAVKIRKRRREGMRSNPLEMASWLNDREDR